MFDTVYTRQKKVDEFVSSSGSRFMPQYRYEVTEGVRNLVKDDVTKDIQAEIDSFAEASDIHVIIQRFINGDPSVLNQTVGQYIDVRDFPKTYAEMFDIVQNGTTYFNSMPDDFRKEFDNNPYRFFESLGTPKYDEILQKFTVNPDTKEKEGVVDAE